MRNGIPLRGRSNFDQAFGGKQTFSQCMFIGAANTPYCIGMINEYAKEVRCKQTTQHDQNCSPSYRIRQDAHQNGSTMAAKTYPEPRTVLMMSCPPAQCSNLRRSRLT